MHEEYILNILFMHLKSAHMGLKFIVLKCITIILICITANIIKTFKAKALNKTILALSYTVYVNEHTTFILLWVQLRQNVQFFNCFSIILKLKMSFSSIGSVSFNQL